MFTRNAHQRSVVSILLFNIATGAIVTSVLDPCDLNIRIDTYADHVTPALCGSIHLRTQNLCTLTRIHRVCYKLTERTWKVSVIVQSGTPVLSTLKMAFSIYILTPFV